MLGAISGAVRGLARGFGALQLSVLYHTMRKVSIDNMVKLTTRLYIFTILCGIWLLLSHIIHDIFVICAFGTYNK